MSGYEPKSKAGTVTKETRCEHEPLEQSGQSNSEAIEELKVAQDGDSGHGSASSHGHDHGDGHGHGYKDRIDSAEKKLVAEVRADLMVHRTDAEDATRLLEGAAALISAPQLSAFTDKIDRARKKLSELDGVQFDGKVKSLLVSLGLEGGDNAALNRELQTLHDQVFRWQNTAYNAFVTEANDNFLREYPVQPVQSGGLWSQADAYETWAKVGAQDTYATLIEGAEEMIGLMSAMPAEKEGVMCWLGAASFDAIVEGRTGSELAYLNRIAREHNPPEWLNDALSTSEWFADFTAGLDSEQQGTVYPKVADLGGEMVMVDSAEEEAEAQGIINRCKTEYGIEISSLKLNKAVSNSYSGTASQAVRSSLRAGAWEMAEVRAVGRALAHYAPILGAKRASSNRSGTAQEVSVIGRGHQAITGSDLDTSTLGEAFGASDAFGLFSAGTTSQVDFPDQDKQLEGTTVHEIAHLLLDYADNDFLQKMDFWASGSTSVYDDGVRTRRQMRDASRAAGTEPPISDYGAKNSSEDFCEAVMFYFVEEATLLSNAPLRHAFIKKLVSDWKTK